MCAGPGILQPVCKFLRAAGTTSPGHSAGCTHATAIHRGEGAGCVGVAQV